MKARKPTETDAQYIARLECANKSLRDHNQQLTEQSTIFIERGRPAASYAALAVKGVGRG